MQKARQNVHHGRDLQQEPSDLTLIQDLDDPDM
jgi:hypothetical protein